MSGHRVLIHERAGRRSFMLDGYIVDAEEWSITRRKGERALLTLTLPLEEYSVDVEGARVERRVDPQAVLERLKEGT